jgi:hypothetical protein
VNRREELHYEWKVRGWDDRQLLEVMRREPRPIEYEFAYDEYQRRERSGQTIKRKKETTTSDISPTDGFNAILRETFWVTKALGSVTLASMQSKLKLQERATRERLKAGVKAGFLRQDESKTALNSVKYIYTFIGEG